MKVALWILWVLVICVGVEKSYHPVSNCVALYKDYTVRRMYYRPELRGVAISDGKIEQMGADNIATVVDKETPSAEGK